MVEEKKSVIALLQNHMEDIGIKHKVKKVHCIIHQEALCAKYSNFKNMMVRAINLILSWGLKHCQFQQLLTEAENQYQSYLLYFCEVRWLIRGALLERVYVLHVASVVGTATPELVFTATTDAVYNGCKSMVSRDRQMPMTCCGKK